MDVSTRPAARRFVRLEDRLHDEGTITRRDVDQARRLSEEAGLPVAQALLRIGAVSEDRLLALQSEMLGLPVLDRDALPDDATPYREALTRLGLRGAWLAKLGSAVWLPPGTERVHVVSRNILDQELREVVETAAAKAGLSVAYTLVSNQVLDTAMHYVEQDEPADADAEFSDSDAARLREMAEEAPVIDFVNRVFSTALKDNASDIHIEPFENQFFVRYRIDGILHTRQTESRQRFDAIASRIKILSNMDIAERRLPQDGRQSIRFAGQDIDLRVSSLPGTWGESIVMRLLKKGGNLPSLAALGLEGHSKRVYERIISSPNGIVIVTGPTGSGKSTTLYRSLQTLDDGIRKIITVEDPVEYDIDGVIQVQTNAKIGYTFASGLRAILRQDPDIIMVGEIRDGETATMAAQAALTGHLVLSTLHTNSALAGVARLIDIGLEPFMVVSAVRGFVAQRLLRRLCPECKVPSPCPEGEQAIWELAERADLKDNALSHKGQWHSPVGCEACSHTGYLGRIAIYEAVEMTEAMSEAILKGGSVASLVRAARQQGFLTLFDDGILKARTGVTSFEELVRVCGTGDSDDRDH